MGPGLRVAIVCISGLSLGSAAGAWTETLDRALSRDARRLVPKSLSQLLGEREALVVDAAGRFPLAPGLAADLESGRLTPETLRLLEAQLDAVVHLFRQQQLSAGLVRLGGLLRIPADLSNPVLTAAPGTLPAPVVRQYYAFAERSLDKIPVVLEDQAALTLSRNHLPAYWQGLVVRSRPQALIIRDELLRNGRVVDQRTLDFRSPVFGVAALSYSRAVTAIAATWLVAWREARGDLTRMPEAREVTPSDRPAAQRAQTLPDASGGNN